MTITNKITKNTPKKTLNASTTMRKEKLSTPSKTYANESSTVSPKSSSHEKINIEKLADHKKIEE